MTCRTLIGMVIDSSRCTEEAHALQRDEGVLLLPERALKTHMGTDTQKYRAMYTPYHQGSSS